MQFDAVKEIWLGIQKDFCSQLSSFDQTPFISDKWQSSLGYGNSCTQQDANVIEKGGVNFSSVQGKALPAAATARNPHLRDKPFFATGVSVVIHPRNPHVPTSHANLRFISVQTSKKEQVWWFGGGFDLTPYYPIMEDCVAWHKAAYDCCRPYDKNAYQLFKQQCDDYFYLPHRQESRGVGGIFYDDLNQWGFDKCLSFSQDVARCYINSYAKIIKQRKDIAYNEQEKLFQNYRRARYAEFNLLYDRGTKFGLQSSGRSESILVSLPPCARWIYKWQMPQREQQIIKDFFRKRDWLGNDKLC